MLLPPSPSVDAVQREITSITIGDLLQKQNNERRAAGLPRSEEMHECRERPSLTLARTVCVVGRFVSYRDYIN